MAQAKEPINTIITIGLAISIFTGFADICIGLALTRANFLLVRSMLLPLAATTFITFIAFITLWFVVGGNLVNRLKLEPTALAISLGAFIATTILLISFNYHSLEKAFPSAEIITKLMIIAAISFIALLVSYFAAKKIGATRQGKHIGYALALMLPILLGEFAIFFWLGKSQILSQFMASACFLAAALITSAIYFKVFRDLHLKTALIAIFVFLVLASPIGFFITAKSSDSSAQGFSPSSDHGISNIILISIDTLRTDVLSSYGSTEVSTPNIDQLAKDGFLFKNAYSPAPWTLPAFSSIMTGLDPLVHKTVNSQTRLPEGFTTIAEYMGGSGYSTGAIGKNIFLGPVFNLDQGFMEYNFYPKSKELIDSFGGALIHIVFPNHYRTDASTSDLTDISIEWIDENRDKDFFLWIHYFDPHIPYAPPAKYITQKNDAQSLIGNEFLSAAEIRRGHFSPKVADKKRIKQLYDAEVRYVDDNVGRLLETIREMGLYDNSLIILTSDHGEEFWEHGGFEHGHTLYNELINVPLIIKLPGIGKNKHIDIEVTTQSIMPTILELSGITYEKDPYLSSSLVPLLNDNPSEYQSKPITSSSLLYSEDRESALFDENKYIRTIVTNEEELYDLKNDPDERFPLSKTSSSDKITQAKKILKERRDEASKSSKHYNVGKNQEVVLDKEKKEKLKALDYIQ